MTTHLREPIDITHANLIALSGSYIRGQRYRSTNFQTVHTILNTTDINNGPIEPLTVTALDSTTLDAFATSETYPGDIIYYELNYSGDWDTTVSYTLGRIYRRIDKDENDICED